MKSRLFYLAALLVVIADYAFSFRLARKSMNLHQFRFVREAVRQNYNLTEAAKALYTSQPGVSKAIIELEEELGVDIFTRHGKRIRSLTEPGRRILESVEKILQEVESLKRVGKDYAAQ